MAYIMERMFNLIKELENEIRVEETGDGVDTKYSLDFILGDIQFRLTYKIPDTLEQNSIAYLNKDTKQTMAKEIIDSLLEYILLNPTWLPK